MIYLSRDSVTLNKDFDLNGKIYRIDNTFRAGVYTVRCRTDKKTLCTRGTLNTCIEKVLEYSRG